MAWLPMAMGIGQKALGGLGMLFGWGGPSEEEKQAMRQLNAQTEMSNRFWQRAQGQQQPVEDWGRAVLQGRSSAIPGMRAAGQRVESERQSGQNLAPRSGGAWAAADPYAKSAAIETARLSLVPTAASALSGLAGQTGGWAGTLSQAAGRSLQGGQRFTDLEASRGKGFYDWLSGTMGAIGDWAGKKWPQKAPAPGGGGTWAPPQQGSWGSPSQWPT